MPLFAETRDRTPVPTLIDDVVRMSQAGVNDEAIIEFIQKSDARIDVTADDLIALTDAKVSKDVIKAVIDYADERDGGRRESKRERVVYRPVYASPYWGYGDPFWDPYWYGPRLRIGFGFGGYRYPHFGGGFYRGGHRRHR
jgi:hypothetical protein